MKLKLSFKDTQNLESAKWVFVWINCKESKNIFIDEIKKTIEKKSDHRGGKSTIKLATIKKLQGGQFQRNKVRRNSFFFFFCNVFCKPVRCCIFRLDLMFNANSRDVWFWFWCVYGTLGSSLGDTVSLILPGCFEFVAKWSIIQKRGPRLPIEAILWAHITKFLLCCD